MQLDEEIEKAFKEGALFAIESSFSTAGLDISVPSTDEIDDACLEYINGSREPSEDTKILDKGHGGSA